MPDQHIQHPPASADAVARACDALRLASQAWPVQFWQHCDGALLDERIYIYATADIAERNRTFEVGRFFPGWLAVGDDSGGRLILAGHQGGEGLWLVDVGAGSLEWAEWFESLGALLAAVREGR